MRGKVISIMLCAALGLNMMGCTQDKKDNKNGVDDLTVWDNGADSGQTEKTHDDKDSKSKKNNKDKDSKEDDVSKRSKDKKRPDKITCTYLKHPVEGTYGKDIYAMGSYYTIKLDEESAQKYPELESAVNEFNSDMEDEIKDFITGSDDEVMELWQEGFTGYYEEDRLLTPVRADEKVFSFVTENYSFYGGAHGSTSFTGYNYDPMTGREISFDDVIRDVSDLPEIIFNELTASNEDLKDYFDELPTDKENLIDGIPERLEDNAKGLSWTVDYDGIRLYFEDYAMGSYAIGTQSAKIRFEDYPEIFTDKYADYTGRKRIPDIEGIAVKLEDAETEKLGDVSVRESRTEGSPDDKKSPSQIINISRDDQQKMNLFVSNFAEQGFKNYDEQYIDFSILAEFAYMWSRINKPANIETEGDYYRISTDKIKSIVYKNFGVRLSDNDLSGSYNWSRSENDGFCKAGYYYVPAADGESYTTFAVVDQAEDEGNNRLRLYFTTYNVSIDTYWDNNESIPKEYYSYNAEEAAAAPYLTQGYQGLAIAEQDGDSYRLKYYRMY